MTDDVVSKNIVTDLVHLTILEFIDICADSEEVPITEKDELLLEINKKIGTRIKELPSEQFDKDINVPDKNVGKIGDLIDRQAAIDALNEHRSIFCDNTPETFRCLPYDEKCRVDEIDNAVATLINLPSAQPEPLTDKEQRIFLAAMSREEKVCEEVDRNHVREPYEDSLMSVCREIKRKVKGALWT